MGNCHCQNATDVKDCVKPIQKNQVSGKNFKFMYCIGRGGFGKVWKVQFTKDLQYYAMKEMQKARIMSRRSLNSVMAERQFLTQLRHPFIVNMEYAFQDQENVYLVSHLMTGGDLRYHIGRRIRFNQHQTKFIIACLTAALSYIHQNCIIHRDIKPENLVFDSNGYLKVTDFGIAKTFQLENAHETSGTPSYMAPEVIFKQNHSYESDYYALGVICYELMLNKRPYKGRTRKELKDQMLHKKIKLRPSQCPAGWDTEVVDFINQCLQRKPCKRLGYNGASEIMQHAWLRNFDWQLLLSEKMVAPFIPGGMDNFDEQHANHEKTENQTEQEELYNKKLLLRRDSIQHLFNGYYFDHHMDKKQQESDDLPNKSTAGRTASKNQTSQNFFSVMSQNYSNAGEKSEKQQNSLSLKSKSRNLKKNLTSDRSAVNSIKYRPEDQKIFDLSIQSEKPGPDIKLSKDLKKLEREDFNNIIGVYRQPTKNSSKSRKSRSDKQQQQTSNGLHHERYKIDKLEEMLIDEEELTKNPEKMKVMEYSEADNDMAHQLYDQHESSDIYNMYQHEVDGMSDDFAEMSPKVPPLELTSGGQQDVKEDQFRRVQVLGKQLELQEKYDDGLKPEQASPLLPPPTGGPIFQGGVNESIMVQQSNLMPQAIEQQLQQQSMSSKRSQSVNLAGDSEPYMCSASAQGNSAREPIDVPQQERALTRQVAGGATLELQNPYINLSSEDSVAVGGVSLEHDQPGSPSNLLPLALENSSQASMSIIQSPQQQQNDIQHYIDEYERENNALQERITMLKQQIKTGAKEEDTGLKQDNVPQTAQIVDSLEGTTIVQAKGPIYDSPSLGLSDDYQVGATVKHSLLGNLLKKQKQKIHIK